ncbi:MFS transporter [Ornithinimicrobium cryptoxanthini]|uniref:MFS transporter n=1 Tax=Ornithinimicrobium cryptoxanthini TaxID=2934161 RepID=A0ABY4YGU0_9MICO|nr:MFS transporter [Ornithinimicrobium cryptoxanthini]USQ75884.1 MFS transporter [Ornithinimicrobium cryptoxanthini]
MSPVASYRRLFALTGPLYVVVAFLGRLPLAMSQLGALLLVSGVTGSYGAGGAVAGALAVANAIAAPMAGGLTDRIGQRPVLLVQSVVGSLGLVSLVLLANAYERGTAWWPLLIVAAVAGAFTPQIGTMARVRWRPISRRAGVERRDVVDAAFSYEGAADEASFVLGPALVGVVGALINPGAAILAAGILLAAFGTWFALHPTSGLVGRPTAHTTADTGRLLTPSLLFLAAVQLSVGVIFGSVQAGTSVLATNAGEPGLTGLFHALLGVGSVLAGLAVVAVPDTYAYESRLRVFTVALAVLVLPLLAVDGLGMLTIALLVLGVAIAPTMITTFTLAERITPVRRLGAAMTILAATTGLGYAVGSSVAGRLADWGGHQPAFVVPVVAAFLAMALALTGARTLRAAQGPPIFVGVS